MEFKMNVNEFVSSLSGGLLDGRLRELYGTSETELLRQRARYISAVENFSRMYPEHSEIRIFSAPGRSEVGGNHTDHQNGCVIAAAVNLDVIAVTAVNDDDVIRIKSEGHKADEIDLSSLEAVPEEKGHAGAMIRGIAAKFKERGEDIHGFDAYTTSDVLSGSGLSSSAAFEVLVGTILDRLFCGGSVGAVEIARFGQYAENSYFGKASGLMDQMVSSVGGFVYIDFENPSEPVIDYVQFDFDSAGYSLCITDTKGSHADLTDDYSAIPTEMKHVASMFGAQVLRQVDEDEFYEKIPELREKCTDREILRAAHFFSENARAKAEADTLKIGDTEEFFRLVRESGEASAELLQNLYSPSHPETQGITLALMLSRHFLSDCGAARVHCGGFAGTIQAFVPKYLAQEYLAQMNRVFGEGSCHILAVRSDGGTEITIG